MKIENNLAPNQKNKFFLHPIQIPAEYWMKLDKGLP